MIHNLGQGGLRWSVQLATFGRAQDCGGCLGSVVSIFLMKPVLALAITSSIPVIGLSALGSLPGVADGNHNTGAEDLLIAAAPTTSEQGKIWVQLSSDVSLATLAQDLELASGTLAKINELTPSAKLKKGAWLVLPQSSKALVSRSVFLESSTLSTRAPLQSPPSPTRTVKVRAGDNVVKLAERHGMTIQDIRKFNPGLNLSRLMIGSEIQVSSASPVFAIVPSTSGGASYPGTPVLPDSEKPNLFQTFIRPTKGVFTSGYGWRWGRMHQGIDIANNVGTPIQASKDGTVAYAGWAGGYGYLVELQHADGMITRYAHNSRLLVSKGKIVRQGDTISLMGSTGRSTGPHLHFEIRKPGGAAVDPLAFIPKA